MFSRDVLIPSSSRLAPGHASFGCNDEPCRESKELRGFLDLLAYQLSRCFSQPILFGKNLESFDNFFTNFPRIYMIHNRCCTVYDDDMTASDDRTN